MQKSIVVLVALAAAAFIAGCGAAGAGSCTVTHTGTYGYCINYSGSSWTADTVRTACTAATGTYSSGDCGSSAAGGTCTFAKGTSTEYKWAFTTTDAGAGVSFSSVCTAGGGTYTAP